MNSLKGTETEKNLLKSFAGESQAKNRYEFFAKQAEKEGHNNIAALFRETAFQEQAHAKKFFRFLEGGVVEITASYPAGVIGTTEENLLAAANGEQEEWEELYPHFAEVAEKEGFKEIAIAFKVIAKAEKNHEERYRKLYDRLNNGSLYSSEEKVKWECSKCGYVHEGKTAPKNCPACNHPQGYFERQKEY